MISTSYVKMGLYELWSFAEYDAGNIDERKMARDSTTKNKLCFTLIVPRHSRFQLKVTQTVIKYLSDI